MGGEGRAGFSVDGASGGRLLLLRADGCLLCIALDSVEGVFDEAPARGLPVVDWATVSGMKDVGAAHDAPAALVLVRTADGLVGLRVEACLGVREVSFLANPPVPTHLTDPNGHPLCYLLHVDRRPHFLLEPAALAQAAHVDSATPRSNRAALPAASPAV